MQALYKETSSLDKRCYETFKLSEDILMEHAADGMADFIRHKFDKGSSIFIACGAGNNGADGIVLARLLHSDYNVTLFLPFGVKSDMAHLQYNRVLALNCTICTEISEHDIAQSTIVVDALFGSGLSRPFDEQTNMILQKLNASKSYKIACDIPSGIKAEGACEAHTFQADTTLSMGALKRNMYLDEAKNFVGTIHVIDLGVSRNLYEVQSHFHLLDTTDIMLPYRHAKNSHKGSYGHLSVVCGDKLGASVIASQAALTFGCGLVTLITQELQSIPYDIMQSENLPGNTTALAIGMGLGINFDTKILKSLLKNNLPLVIDADMFSHKFLLELLTRENIVITPHPKEFVQLLKLTKIASITVEELQANRFHYTQLFHEKYFNVTLLLKGANVIIASKHHYYVNPHGSAALAKGGSGDVLSGMIGSLLAQGYAPHDASIQASLAHSLALQKSDKHSYAMSPFDIIEGISRL